MEEQDIRWKQRFSNYQKALAQLRGFTGTPALSDREIQGLIKCFEYTFELGWNVMKDYLQERGATVRMVGSKDAIRAAFREGLIADGTEWMNMVDDRNKTAHTYDELKAAEVAKHILNIYCPLFEDFSNTMQRLLP